MAACKKHIASKDYDPLILALQLLTCNRWPVIAGIIVGGLIIFSVLWCMIRCCCCGMSCCCTCFSFLKCCDCCGGACDGKKDKPTKHRDDVFAPYAGGAITSGYRAPAAMPAVGGGFGSKPEPPQYAQFDVGRNGLAVDPKPLSEDALPPMPSWETAQKKHVVEEDSKDAVELGELNPATGQKMPLMGGNTGPGSSIPPSPVNEMGNGAPYGARDGQNGYMGVAAGDPYATSQNNVARGYGPQSSGGPNGYTSPPPQDIYGQNTNFVAAAAPNGYNRPQRQNTGDRPYNQMGGQRPLQMPRQYTGNSSVTQGSQYSNQSNNYNTQPPRGPSRGPGTPINRMASPAQSNTAFDFGNNHSPRPQYAPQQQSYNSGRQQTPSNNDYYDNASVAPSYHSRAPASSQEPQYSGYDYDSQAGSNHRRDPTALRPAGGNVGGAGRDRREPQGWDPVNARY